MENGKTKQISVEILVKTNGTCELILTPVDHPELKPYRKVCGSEAEARELVNGILTMTKEMSAFSHMTANPDGLAWFGGVPAAALKGQGGPKN